MNETRALPNDDVLFPEVPADACSGGGNPALSSGVRVAVTSRGDVRLYAPNMLIAFSHEAARVLCNQLAHAVDMMGDAGLFPKGEDAP